MIADVSSVAVLKLFLEADDDLNLAPTEVKRAFVGIGNHGIDNGAEFQSSRRDFEEHKSPRFGTRNPERMDNPFWSDMIRLGGNACSARQHFDASNPRCPPDAVWCYDRFGASLTPLEDGRFVQIAGEHEDFYDPDFQIYNDVVVHDGEGNFQIYGYPEHVFLSTDFHTATLVRGWIYIIGCLGYPEQRTAGHTPVYRLKLDTWEMEAVETSGEMPGWIHRHRARYVPEHHMLRVTGGDLHVVDQDGDSELVANQESFALDLSSFQWRKRDGD